MAITLPYTIAEGDQSNHHKIEENFRHIENKLNTEAYAIPSLADADAPNSTLYYSTTQSKLVWKDSGGVVNNLY